MNPNLAGPTVVVTDAAKGFGTTTAQAFSDGGAHVALAAGNGETRDAAVACGGDIGTT